MREVLERMIEAEGPVLADYERMAELLAGALTDVRPEVFVFNPDHSGGPAEAFADVVADPEALRELARISYLMYA